MARPTKRAVINKHISEALCKLTPDATQKLEQMYSMDSSIKEIAYYLDVSAQTIYNWKEKNPELFDKLERLRERPVLKARQTVIKSLDDPNHAFRYLEKKAKKEFGVSVDITSGGDPLGINPEKQKKVEDTVNKFLNERNK